MFYPQLNAFLEQNPMTYIDDTTAPIGDLNFPSVTICNINQVSFLVHLDLNLFEGTPFFAGASRPRKQELWNHQLLPAGQGLVIIDIISVIFAIQGEGKLSKELEDKVMEKLVGDQSNQTTIASIAAQECNID